MEKVQGVVEVVHQRLADATRSISSISLYKIEASNAIVRQILIVMSGFFVFFNVWGFVLAFGTLQSYYSTDFLNASSVSSISWIGSVQGCLLIVAGVPAGQLYDMGYFRFMALGGSFVATLGFFMLSLCHQDQYWEVMLAQGITIGIGSGILYVPVLAAVGETFATNGGKGRAVAMGVVTSGVGVGGVVYTLAFSHLITSLSFANTIRILSYIALGTFLLAISILVLLCPPPTFTTTTTNRRPRRLLDSTALTDSSFLLFTITSFFLFLAYLIPLFLTPTYALESLRLSSQTSNNLLAISAGSSTAGRLITSAIVSSLSQKHHLTPAITAWAVCASTSAILCFAWIAVHNTGGFVAFTVLYGFCTGGLISLPPAIFPGTCCPDAGMLGTRLGMSWMVMGVAFLVGTPIAGAILGGGERGWVGVQAFAGAVMGLGALGVGVFAVVVRRRSGG